jgi:hypothetical protein
MRSHFGEIARLEMLSLIYANLCPEPYLPSLSLLAFSARMKV